MPRIIDGVEYSDAELEMIQRASPQGWSDRNAQRNNSRMDGGFQTIDQEGAITGYRGNRNWGAGYSNAPQMRRQQGSPLRTRNLPTGRNVRSIANRGWDDEEGMSFTFDKPDYRSTPGMGQTVMPGSWGSAGYAGLPASGSRLPSGRSSPSFYDRYFGGYGGSKGYNPNVPFTFDKKYGRSQVGNARSRSRSLGDDEIDADLRFSPEKKTGGFFGGGREIGINKETLDLGMAAYGLYGDWQDRAAAGRAEGRAITESARIGKYAATNLANKAQMVNFKYDQLRDWMDVNDPNRERYTRPTNVATSI